MIKGKLINNYSKISNKGLDPDNNIGLASFEIMIPKSIKLETIMLSEILTIIDDNYIIGIINHLNQKNKYNKRIKNREELYLKRKALGRKL